MKPCSKCNVVKPFGEFSKQKGGKFGLRAACKQCVTEIYRESRETYLVLNKEKRNASSLEWYKKNRDRAAENKARHYLENKAQYLENRAQYRSANSAQLAEKNSLYQKANRKTLSARALARRAVDPAYRDYQAQYLLSHREELAEYRRTYNKRNSASLSDSYVMQTIRQSLPEGIKAEDLPKDFIEAKRLRIKIHRLLKEKTK